MFVELIDAKPSRIIGKLPQKISFGSETWKLEQKSELGHVHHVPKAPSENETVQKNNTSFVSMHLEKYHFFLANLILYLDNLFIFYRRNVYVNVGKRKRTIF